MGRKLNWLKKIAGGPSLEVLMSLRPDIAALAQQIYDAWDASHDEYGDAEFGFGGICDAITREIENLIAGQTSFEVAEGAAEGEDHSFPVVKTPEGYYIIDIPCHIYETGGGMNWTKTPGVTISPNDVYIGYLGNEDYYWPEQEEVNFDSPVYP